MHMPRSCCHSAYPHACIRSYLRPLRGGGFAGMDPLQVHDNVAIDSLPYIPYISNCIVYYQLEPRVSAVWLVCVS